jgi:hypothetical protein
MASRLKRTRRTKLQVERLDQQIIDALQRDHPQSVRHVFYLMTNPRFREHVPKDTGYDVVQSRCVKLRRAGRLPCGYIIDATRRGYFTNTYSGAGDFMQRVAGLYRADLWKNSDFYCEVWCESRSIAGVIEADCEELAVSLYPAGGFSSISLAFEAAEFINQEHRGRDVVIFYIGDYDPAGVLIDVSIEREIRQHLSNDIALQFTRIGITAEQVAAYDLPTKPRNKNDRRALHIKRTVEAEAMPAHILRGLLRDAIEALLPDDALEAAREAEDREREMIGDLADGLKRRIRS